MKKLFYKFKWQYPKYMHHISEVPTESEFIEAWKLNYGNRHPDDCDAKIFDDKSGICAFGKDYYLGGGQYLDNDSPIDVAKCDSYYGGCGNLSAIDKNGNTYALLDKDTNLPVKWEEFKARVIIKRYLIDTNIHHAEYPKMILRTTQERLQDLHEWISEKEGMPLTQETITELMQNIIDCFITSDNPLKSIFK